MKKIATLLLILLSFAGISISAQTPTCNAAFAINYQSGNTILFSPAVPGDPSNTFHFWNFGDGATSSQATPVHTYTSGSVFIVQHMISVFLNGTVICRDSTFMTVQVQNTCNLSAGFYSYRDSLTTLPNPPYHFISTTTPQNPTDSIRWTFGDGSSSNLLNPIHTYAQPGLYLVCLRVQQRTNTGALSNCISETCDSVVVPDPAACNLVAYFNASQQSPQNTFIFQNLTSGASPSDSIRWTFGDGFSSNQINPLHVYAQAGVYLVCLRVQKRSAAGVLTNCVSEYCHAVAAQNPSTCVLTANFYAYRDSIITVPFAYNFVNTTTPQNANDSIRWTFGDGTSSNQLNPSHIYTQPGTYNVCLRVQQRNSNGTLSNCISEKCQIVIVQNVCNLVVGFAITPVTTSPNTYHFQNASAPSNNTDSIRWTFGDGTSSSELHPNHTYAQPGNYTVCLVVMQRGLNGGPTTCAGEICRTLIVPNTNPCTLVAGFYYYRDSIITVQNSYHFVNTSAPLNNTDSIRWTFGDGSSSNQLNPVHVYSQPGTYTVCLRIQQRDAIGGLTNCIKETCQQVTVTPVCNIQSSFSWRADSLNSRKIYFTNQSVSPAANAIATWTFGDGTTSTAWNPVHEYAQPGRYNVCLKIQTSATCFSYSCDSIIVQAPLPSCTQQSNFSFVRSNNNTLLFNFTPAYTNSSWQYTWTFGDGTGSHDITPVHQYAQSGNYTVCLTVFRNAGCASTTCRTVAALTPVNCNNVNVTYTYQRDPVVTNKLFFRAVSNYTIVSQTWTIKKIATTPGTPTVTLLQNNPSYVFQDTGWYRVCLRAVTLGGCVKEYCSDIYIQQVFTPTNCNLQLFPNPVTSLLNINIYLTQPQMLDVYIYNSQNVLVKEKHQQGYTGTNIIYIPVSSLVAGNYTVKLIHGNSVCYAQFVKL